jgi:hypothetical protein
LNPTSGIASLDHRPKVQMMEALVSRAPRMSLRFLSNF